MRSRRFISFITAVSLLMSLFGALPVSADYSNDAETGTYIWDFAEYTTAVSSPTSLLIQEEYEGLIINIGNNDNITTEGVYWSNGVTSGNNPRCIEYTPDKDGTLYVTGYQEAKNRWGISTSLDISSFAADETSSQSTSSATVQKECAAGETYYIFGKGSTKTYITNIRYVTEPAVTSTSEPTETSNPTEAPKPTTAPEPTEIPEPDDMPTGLLTNELEYPLNVEAPTFSWIVNAEGNDVVQTAYRIVVTDEINDVEVWDSGKVASSEQSYIPCGEALSAGHPYSWKVKTWTKAGNADEVESEYSDDAYFVTGLKTSSDWDAKWISDGTGGASEKEGTYDHFWYVKKEQAITADKTVAKAYAFISGLQDYDLYVNDAEIGRGQSFDYASESRYQGWDITDATRKDSANINITALVRTYGGGQGRAAVDAGFLGHIVIYFTDGTSQTITTDNTWQVSGTTPYAADKTKRNGEGDFVEKYDARKSQGGSWTAATEITSPTDTPIAELSKPTDYLVHPVSVTKLNDGTTIADFGKVIPARPQITFASGTAGTALTIWGGYVLNSDGTVNTSNAASQSTSMRWVYTQKAGAQVFNAWDHLAFRYLQIPDCSETLTAETIAAKVVHTNVPNGRDSVLTTSNQMLNDVYELMKRSAIYGVQNEFVDTPTREKGQFTDDARNISEATVATQFEREATRKALNQFMASADRYWKNEDGTYQGRYNSVYPNVDGKRDIPEYSVNFPQWVWNYYINTGDKATLTQAYPYIKATADYISDNINETTGLVEKLAGGDSNPNEYRYGIVDWPASGRFGYDWSGCKNGAFTTVNMLSKHAFDVVALAAAELGNEADKADMENRSAELKTAINGKLRNSDGLYVDGTTNSSGAQSSHISQHANSYAFAFDVIPENDAKKETVAKYIADGGMQQGPMTADILAKGLFNAGENTAALKLFTEPNDYGWAYEVANGYSFTFESWIADRLDNEDSQSHAWGATAASDILKNFAGVTVTEAGAKRIKIAPVYVDLESLNAKVSTERGKVGVKYERSDSKYEITITVPANVTADIVLPNVGEGTYKLNNSSVENELTVGSGTYTFTFDGSITPPEEVVYNDAPEEPTDTETEVYSLVDKLSAEIVTQNSDIKLNDWASLHVGTGSTAYSSANGVDMYNDGSYITLTPSLDGKISLDVKLRKSNSGNAASTIYMSTTGQTSGGTSLHSTVSTDTDLTISDVEVKAGETYYIYNSAGRPTSIKKLSYTHEKQAITGIKGAADTVNRIYDWTIGSGETNNTYSDTSDIVDLTVSLGSGDSLSETNGIVFSGTAVPDSGSVTDRYLLVEPKRSGTFTINITGKGTKNNRVYYYDFGTGEVSLSKCTKDGGTIAKQLDANKATDVTIAMTAGNKYVVYPYTNAAGGVISSMSYAYTDKEIEVTPDGLDKKYMHISFDDVYACLKDITDNKNTYNSVFENSFLNELRTLHNTYGAVFTLNCFITTTKDSSYDISNLPDKYASELAANDDWLKFAFHAQDDNAIYGATTGTSSGTLSTVSKTKTSYKKFADAIMTATGGNTDSIDTVTRLGFFSGSVENIAALSECDYGITGLLTADDSRLSYYFDTVLNSHINKYGYHYDEDTGLKLIKTITRLEGNKEVSSFSTTALDNCAGNMIEVFTHESEYLDKSTVRDNLASALAWAKTNNCGFGYAMDLLEKPEVIVPNIEYEDPDASVVPTEPQGTSISLDRTTYPLVVGNSSKTDFSRWHDQGSAFTLTATINSGDYTDSDIKWSMDDPEIAYIRDNVTSGKSVSIRGKRTGFTRAVASLPNGDRAVCYISVIDNITRSTVQSLEFNTDTLNLTVGSKATLIPIINPKDVFGNGALDTNVGWASEDNDIVKVNNGVVTAVAPGTAKIMAKSNDIGRKTYCTVTVTEGAAAAASSTVLGTITDMTVGDTKTLANAAADVVWRSDNSFIADVGENGFVTAYSNSNTEKLTENERYAEGNTSEPLKATDQKIVFENGKVQYEQGTVKIYATTPDGSVTTYKVRVSDAQQKIHKLKISDSKTALGIGDTKTITAAILPANMMDKRVVWTSSDPSVASVGNNALTITELNSTVITGVSAGTATITALCDGETAACEVTVTPVAVKISDITITGAKEIDIDEVLELDADVTANAYNTELLWLSSDSDIVSVNDDGMIQGLKSGSVSIYAFAADSLTQSQRTELEGLQYERTVSESDLKAFLSGKVYGSCDITVKESSPYLRNLHAPKEAVTSDSINLLWNRASLLDTGDFDSYNVYVNGTPTANVKTLGYTADNLNENTEYTFMVDAVKADGKTVLESAAITVKTKAAGKVINVMDAPYNATGDGKHTDTFAIQKAIAVAGEGDTVYLPEGHIFYSGALYLKSNMTFKVDGILIGSTYSKDYPFMVTRWEGWRKVNQTGSDWANTTDTLPDNHYAHSSLINAGVYDEGKVGHTGAYNVENLVICGNGQINANGFKLGYNEGMNQKTGNGGIPVPMSPAIDQTIRGRAITIHNADGVYMKDVQVAYSPSWTIHPIFNKNLTVDNLDVVSKGNGVTGAADGICILNGDGVDPDSSVKVNIFNTYFYTGDDAVAVKTGRDKEGNELKKPGQFIRITDSETNGSKGGFAVGSENASGVRNVLMQNLKMRSVSLHEATHFKSVWSRGGLSENLIIRDIDSSSSDHVEFKMDYGTASNNPADNPPEYRYITVENSNTKLIFTGLGAGNGRDATYINNVTVRGAKAGGEIEYGKDFEIWDAAQSDWTVKSHTDNIEFKYSNMDTSTKIKKANSAPHIVSIDNDKKILTVQAGTTESEILSEITSEIPDIELGYELSNENTVLAVTAADGKTTGKYKIVYVKYVDFRTWTPQSDMSTGDATADGITVHGGSSDNITAANGVHYNGTAANGNRYVQFTLDSDSTVTITGSVVTRFYVSASPATTGQQVSGDGTIHLEAGTYYMYPSGGATNLYTLTIVPDTDDEPDENIIDSISDKIVKIEKIEENGETKLIVTPTAESEITVINLYEAIYNSGNTLKEVRMTSCTLGEDGTIIVPLTEPQLENSESYRLMLWDLNQSPIISAITSSDNFFD